MLALCISGILCLEGPSEDCHEAWTTIKSMVWKRIGLKFQETSKLVGAHVLFKATVIQLFKFSSECLLYSLAPQGKSQLEKSKT